MGEFIFDVVGELIGAFIEFMFSPAFLERLPRPVRTFFRIFFILVLIAALGLIMFAGILALFSFFKKGSSVLVLIGGLILIGAVIGFIAFLVHTLKKKF